MKLQRLFTVLFKFSAHIFLIELWWAAIWWWWAINIVSSFLKFIEFFAFEWIATEFLAGCIWRTNPTFCEWSYVIKKREEKKMITSNERVYSLICCACWKNNVWIVFEKSSSIHYNVQQLKHDVMQLKLYLWIHTSTKLQLITSFSDFIFSYLKKETQRKKEIQHFITSISHACTSANIFYFHNVELFNLNIHSIISKK